jgi:hypothetical protein
MLYRIEFSSAEAVIHPALALRQALEEAGDSCALDRLGIIVMHFEVEAAVLSI